MQNKRICIVGLGYVGLTLSLVLSEKKFKVFGFDLNKKLLKNLAEFLNSRIRKKYQLFIEKKY